MRANTIPPPSPRAGSEASGEEGHTSRAPSPPLASRETSGKEGEARVPPFSTLRASLLASYREEEEEELHPPTAPLAIPLSAVASRAATTLSSERDAAHLNLHCGAITLGTPPPRSEEGEGRRQPSRSVDPPVSALEIGSRLLQLAADARVAQGAGGGERLARFAMPSHLSRHWLVYSLLAATLASLTSVLVKASPLADLLRATSQAVVDSSLSFWREHLYAPATAMVRELVHRHYLSVSNPRDIEDAEELLEQLLRQFRSQWGPLLEAAVNPSATSGYSVGVLFHKFLAGGESPDPAPSITGDPLLPSLRSTFFPPSRSSFPHSCLHPNSLLPSSAPHPFPSFLLAPLPFSGLRCLPSLHLLLSYSIASSSAPQPLESRVRSQACDACRLQRRSDREAREWLPRQRASRCGGCRDGGNGPSVRTADAISRLQHGAR